MSEHIAKKSCEAGKSYGESKSTSAADTMKEHLYKNTNDYVAKNHPSDGIDVLLICSMAIADNSNTQSEIKKFLETKRKLSENNIDNMVLTAIFCNLDTKYLLGSGDENKYPKRLDKIMKPVYSTDAEGNTTETESTTPFVNWEQRNSWSWKDIIEPLTINIQGGGIPSSVPSELEWFSKLIYLYYELSKKCSFSCIDGVLAFPFVESQLREVWYTRQWSTGMVHPVTGTVRKHDGIDLATGREGDEIHAAGNGTVVLASPDGALNGYGNLLVIKHPENILTGYAHMKDLLLREGANVTKGQVIGHIGNTGIGTGPHLHYEVRKADHLDSHYCNCTSIDPVANCYPQLGALQVGSAYPSIGEQIGKG